MTRGPIMSGLASAPTFYPTDEEFADFEGYLRRLQAQCAGYGLCKVVPPAGWLGHASTQRQTLSRAGFVIHSPIEQHVCGQGGVYQVINQERTRMTLDRFERQVELVWGGGRVLLAGL